MHSVDDIFLAARELADPAERAAYLAQACGSDAALRGRVEAMLRDAAGADAYFERTDHGLPQTDALPLTEKPGAVIGRYKLLQQIGEGGVGIVYMAEQREPVVRKVALKIIKVGMDNQTVLPGASATFTASAIGSGISTYQWQFNGTNLPNATSASLTVTNVQARDAGTYAVVVTATSVPLPATFAATLTLGVPTLPPLRITLSGTNALLAWPVSAGAAVLERTSTLPNAPGVWNVVSEVRQTNAGSVSVTVPCLDRAFFRLRAP